LISHDQVSAVLDSLDINKLVRELLEQEDKTLGMNIFQRLVESVGFRFNKRAERIENRKFSAEEVSQEFKEGSDSSDIIDINSSPIVFEEIIEDEGGRFIKDKVVFPESLE